MYTYDITLLACNNINNDPICNLFLVFNVDHLVLFKRLALAQSACDRVLFNCMSRWQLSAQNTFCLPLVLLCTVLSLGFSMKVELCKVLLYSLIPILAFNKMSWLSF